MQENSNWYWKQQPLQHTIIIPTHTILHPHIDVIIIRFIQDTHKNICSRNQLEKAIQIHTIIVTVADYDYILDEIERREKLSLKVM